MTRLGYCRTPLPFYDTLGGQRDLAAVALRTHGVSASLHVMWFAPRQPTLPGTLTSVYSNLLRRDQHPMP